MRAPPLCSDLELGVPRPRGEKGERCHCELCFWTQSVPTPPPKLRVPQEGPRTGRDSGVRHRFPQSLLMHRADSGAKWPCGHRTARCDRGGAPRWTVTPFRRRVQNVPRALTQGAVLARALGPGQDKLAWEQSQQEQARSAVQRLTRGHGLLVPSVSSGVLFLSPDLSRGHALLPGGCRASVTGSVAFCAGTCLSPCLCGRGSRAVCTPG